MVSFYLGALLLLATIVAGKCARPIGKIGEMDWETFKERFSKTYNDSLQDEQFRRRVWANGLSFIHNHNVQAALGKFSFTLGENKYSDLSPEEINAKLNTYQSYQKIMKGEKFKLFFNVSLLPPEVDWREYGAVSRVKDQGECGACWSFAATGAIEGRLAVATGKLVSLSEQNLIDCSQIYGNNGCSSGIVQKAYQYVIDNGGINTEDDYPFAAVQTQHQCRYNKSKSVGSISGFIDIPEGSEQWLQVAVAKVGPVSAAIDSSLRTFQQYRSGIYYDPACSTTNINHGVLVVGYGSEGDNDYWLIKNSWGSSWGEDGYGRIARNRGNHCGIATQATFPRIH